MLKLTAPPPRAHTVCLHYAQRTDDHQARLNTFELVTERLAREITLSLPYLSISRDLYAQPTEILLFFGHTKEGRSTD